LAPTSTFETEVVTSIRRVTDIMAEITAASQEQSQGIEHVNHAITQMDEVTQQNAALVEEAAAAAESLSEQSAALESRVAMFRIDGQDTAEFAAPVAAHPAVERRGPNRATNVTRPAFRAKTSAGGAAGGSAPAPAKAAPKATAKTGTDDDSWEEF
jgi:uncharacterized phage infection (PIP) family protein YhgE